MIMTITITTDAMIMTITITTLPGTQTPCLGWSVIVIKRVCGDGCGGEIPFSLEKQIKMGAGLHVDNYFCRLSIFATFKKKQKIIQKCSFL